MISFLKTILIKMLKQNGSLKITLFFMAIMFTVVPVFVVLLIKLCEYLF